MKAKSIWLMIGVSLMVIACSTKNEPSKNTPLVTPVIADWGATMEEIDAQIQASGQTKQEGVNYIIGNDAYIRNGLVQIQQTVKASLKDIDIPDCYDDTCEFTYEVYYKKIDGGVLITYEHGPNEPDNGKVQAIACPNVAGAPVGQKVVAIVRPSIENEDVKRDTLFIYGFIPADTFPVTLGHAEKLLFNEGEPIGFYGHEYYRTDKDGKQYKMLRYWSVWHVYE